MRYPPLPPSTTFSLTFSVFEGERKGWEWGKKKEKDYLIPRCLRLPPFRSLLGWRKQKSETRVGFYPDLHRLENRQSECCKKAPKNGKIIIFGEFEREGPLSTHTPTLPSSSKGGRKEEKKQKQDQEEEEGFSPADGEVRGGGAPLTPLSQKRRREGSCIM